MAEAASSRKTAYAALGVLLLTYMMSYVDRTALGVLQEPIKRELGLSDWQLGLLSGPAFALLYSIMGIPIARLAERYDRARIIAACLFLWSAMTMLCGVAQNYAQMLAARVGVSIGEAGGNPSSHSLIADLFPQAERARAIAIYSFGVPVGAFLGAALTGWLAHVWGWRTAFLILGPMGFVLLLAVLRFIPDVPRGRHDGGSIATDGAPPPALRAVLAILGRSPVFRHLAAGAALVVLAGYGIASFLAPFLMRRYGLDIGAAGLFSGIVNGSAAGIGTLASGFAADRFGRRDVRFYAWMPAAMMLIATPCFVLGFLTDTLWLSIVLLTIGTMAIYTYIAPTFAQLHNMVEARMRATASSVLYLIINLIGLGIGPPLIGAVSDYAARDAFAKAGAGSFAQCRTPSAEMVALCQQATGQGITVALVAVSLLLLWAALHFQRAGHYLGRAGLA